MYDTFLGSIIPQSITYFTTSLAYTDLVGDPDVLFSVSFLPKDEVDVFEREVMSIFDAFTSTGGIYTLLNIALIILMDGLIKNLYYSDLFKSLFSTIDDNENSKVPDESI